jgi:hypothetical protein
MNMNSKLPSKFACFLPYRDSRRENVGKKIGQKIGQRMRPVQIFGILAVLELPFRLRYCSFGSLMPDAECQYAQCRRSVCRGALCVSMDEFNPTGQNLG